MSWPRRSKPIRTRCVLAGGTDVGLWVTKQLRELPSIVYIGEVAELKQIAARCRPAS